jgi:hypothetical protein
MDESRNLPGKAAKVLLRLRKKVVPDFCALVASYNSKELASPKRSTVPLLAYWAHPEARLRDLCTNLGCNPSGPLEFHFEFPVRVQAGAGKPSFTDLMILSPTFVIAIEAKYTEPAYKTVKDWLGDSLRSNRIAVLDGWIKLIEKGTGVRLSAPELSIHPYQLVHRMASACFPPATQRWVVYQLFSDTIISYYQEHLSAIYHLLRGQIKLSFALLLSPPEVSAEYMRLKNLWASGQRDLSDPVRSGLLSDSLFKFKGVQFIGVSSQNAAI